MLHLATEIPQSKGRIPERDQGINFDTYSLQLLDINNSRHNTRQKKKKQEENV